MTHGDLRGKTALVTGANQGIGRVSALELAKMGAAVVMVCRSEEKGRAAREEIVAQVKGATVELIVGDVSSLASLREVAVRFLDGHDRLDILLNNAGVLATSRRESADGFEHTFATNHIGYFYLTHLLRPTLERTPGARVVSVSSEAHRRGVINFDDLHGRKRWSATGSYSASKLANVLFTRELARRLADTGVTANCLHPGVIGSGFASTDGGIVAMLARLVRPLLLTNEEGAKTQVYLCSSPEVAGVTGKYFDKCKERAPSRAAQDDAVARDLWRVSEELCGLKGGVTLQ